MSNTEKPDLEHEALQSLPNGVLLSWGKVKQPKRGPKGELSIPQIVEAAVKIADRDGLAAVSMNRVAQSLGFTTMSLYRYITSKEDLLVLMQDAVCAVEPPAERPESQWREEMKDYVWLSLQMIRKHPWYVDVPITGVPVTPNNLLFVDWGIRTMRNLELNDYEKISFVLLLSGYARHYGILLRDMDRAIGNGATEDSFSGRGYTEALKHLVRQEDYPNLYPMVQSGVYTEEGGEPNPIGDDLEFGLNRILDGIEMYVESKKGK
ncbi:TetR/AcrR family transcriptional regulator [Cohnella thailandensis]|uniref:TetR/AcrR family transcriptional regulator n=1 Tax=Cohnella thailandensis TaxID=557557 RepID=A0A841SM91_9BACL|nr:TetR/AcrR family transcriptional regulator [Cohnella thailandensis]MBB6633593.1 TetR/AcrR family transcriptional regulator [Cohnella thailandensis]MBP1974612.1 AcrR family transcriptional regulator [Cohnella thailandensis]